MAEEKDFDIFETLNPPSKTDQDLAALLFAETTPPPTEPPPVVAGEETLTAAEAEEEAPVKPGFFARLKGLFRRKAAPVEAEEAEEEVLVAETPADAADEEEESIPSGFNKKLLVVALAVLALLGAGIGGTALVFQHLDASRQAEQQKREAELATEKAELAAEKAQVEKQKAELAALKAQNEKQAQEAAAKTAEQPVAGAVAAKPSPEAGDVDCAVVGKENAAQTIKRCIEAYNKATGRTK